MKILLLFILLIGLLVPYQFTGTIQVYKPGGYCGSLTDYIQPGVNQIVWLDWQIEPPVNRIGPVYHLSGDLYTNYGLECQILEVTSYQPIVKVSTGSR